jgi:hypothetical protein
MSKDIVLGQLGQVLDLGGESSKSTLKLFGNLYLKLNLLQPFLLLVEHLIP